MRRATVGLVLESEFPIVQLPQVPAQEPDVRILRADLSGLTPEQRRYSGPDGCYFRGQDLCAHRITGGNRIEVALGADYDPSKLSVYLMGTCMGAIHYQRGLMMLHGSCVTDGQRAILLTGDSGAGKSTLAAESPGLEADHRRCFRGLRPGGHADGPVQLSLPEAVAGCAGAQ